MAYTKSAFSKKLTTMISGGRVGGGRWPRPFSKTAKGQISSSLQRRQIKPKTQVARTKKTSPRSYNRSFETKKGFITTKRTPIKSRTIRSSVGYGRGFYPNA